MLDPALDLRPNNRGAILVAGAAALVVVLGVCLPWLEIDSTVRGFQLVVGKALLIFAVAVVVLAVAALLSSRRPRWIPIAMKIAGLVIAILALRVAVDTDRAIQAHGLWAEVKSGPVVAAAGGGLIVAGAFWLLMCSDSKRPY